MTNNLENRPRLEIEMVVDINSHNIDDLAEIYPSSPYVKVGRCSSLKGKINRVWGRSQATAKCEKCEYQQTISLTRTKFPLR